MARRIEKEEDLRQEETPDYYVVLNCVPTSTQNQIKAEYRALCTTHHPDKDPEKQEDFLRIKKAYEILGDPEIRANYDRWRTANLDMDFHAYQQMVKEGHMSIHWREPRGPSTIEHPDHPGTHHMNMNDTAHKPSSSSSASGRSIRDRFKNYDI
eukprot:Clim_evm27s25 gene=Clim_evmTU27s25